MPEYNPKVRHRIYLLQLLAFLMITGVFVYVVDTFGSTQDDLCRQSDANREAIKGMAVAISNLGTSLVLHNAAKPGDITEGQRQAIAQFRAFRNQQVERLSIPVC